METENNNKSQQTSLSLEEKLALIMNRCDKLLAQHTEKDMTLSKSLENMVELSIDSNPYTNQISPENTENCIPNDFNSNASIKKIFSSKSHDDINYYGTDEEFLNSKEPNIINANSNNNNGKSVKAFVNSAFIRIASKKCKQTSDKLFRVGSCRKKLTLNNPYPLSQKRNQNNPHTVSLSNSGNCIFSSSIVQNNSNDFSEPSSSMNNYSETFISGPSKFITKTPSLLNPIYAGEPCCIKLIGSANNSENPSTTTFSSLRGRMPNMVIDVLNKNPEKYQESYNTKPPSPFHEDTFVWKSNISIKSCTISPYNQDNLIVTNPDRAMFGKEQELSVGPPKCLCDQMEEKYVSLPHSDFYPHSSLLNPISLGFPGTLDDFSIKNSENYNLPRKNTADSSCFHCKTYVKEKFLNNDQVSTYQKQGIAKINQQQHTSLSPINNKNAITSIENSLNCLNNNENFSNTIINNNINQYFCVNNTDTLNTNKNNESIISSCLPIMQEKEGRRIDVREQGEKSNSYLQISSPLLRQHEPVEHMESIFDAHTTSSQNTTTALNLTASNDLLHEHSEANYNNNNLNNENLINLPPCTNENFPNVYDGNEHEINLIQSHFSRNHSNSNYYIQSEHQHQYLLDQSSAEGDISEGNSNVIPTSNCLTTERKQTTHYEISPEKDESPNDNTLLNMTTAATTIISPTLGGIKDFLFNNTRANNDVQQTEGICSLTNNIIPYNHLDMDLDSGVENPTMIDTTTPQLRIDHNVVFKQEEKEPTNEIIHKKNPNPLTNDGLSKNHKQFDEMVDISSTHKDNVIVSSMFDLTAKVAKFIDSSDTSIIVVPNLDSFLNNNDENANDSFIGPQNNSDGEEDNNLLNKSLDTLVPCDENEEIVKKSDLSSPHTNINPDYPAINDMSTNTQNVSHHNIGITVSDINERKTDLKRETNSPKLCDTNCKDKALNHDCNDITNIIKTSPPLMISYTLETSLLEYPDIRDDKFLHFNPFEAGADEENDAWTSLRTDKKFLKQYTSKEIKKQDIIHELIMTEKVHLQTLSIVNKIYAFALFHVIKQENDILKAIFTHAQNLFHIHLQFYEALRNKKQQSIFVEQIGDVLLDQFTGECANKMKLEYGEFCSEHKCAIQAYKRLIKADKDVANYFQNCLVHPLCRRKSVPECILAITQRITKYPILLESIIKAQKGKKQPANIEDENLNQALIGLKSILTAVDERIAKRELKDRFKDIVSQIDPKSQAFFEGQIITPNDLIQPSDASQQRKGELMSHERELVFEGGPLDLVYAGVNNITSPITASSHTIQGHSSSTQSLLAQNGTGTTNVSTNPLTDAISNYNNAGNQSQQHNTTANLSSVLSLGISKDKSGSKSGSLGSSTGPLAHNVTLSHVHALLLSDALVFLQELRDKDRDKESGIRYKFATTLTHQNLSYHHHSNAMTMSTEDNVLSNNSSTSFASNAKQQTLDHAIHPINKSTPIAYRGMSSVLPLQKLIFREKAGDSSAFYIINCQAVCPEMYEISCHNSKTKNQWLYQLRKTLASHISTGLRDILFLENQQNKNGENVEDIENDNLSPTTQRMKSTLAREQKIYLDPSVKENFRQELRKIDMATHKVHRLLDEAEKKDYEMMLITFAKCDILSRTIEPLRRYETLCRRYQISNQQHNNPNNLLLPSNAALRECETSNISDLRTVQRKSMPPEIDTSIDSVLEKLKRETESCLRSRSLTTQIEYNKALTPKIINNDDTTYTKTTSTSTHMAYSEQLTNSSGMLSRALTDSQEDGLLLSLDQEVESKDLDKLNKSCLIELRDILQTVINQLYKLGEVQIGKSPAPATYQSLIPNLNRSVSDVLDHNKPMIHESYKFIQNLSQNATSTTEADSNGQNSNSSQQPKRAETFSGFDAKTASCNNFLEHHNTTTTSIYEEHSIDKNIIKEDSSTQSISLVKKPPPNHLDITKLKESTEEMNNYGRASSIKQTNTPESCSTTSSETSLISSPLSTSSMTNSTRPNSQNNIHNHKNGSLMSLTLAHILKDPKSSFNLINHNYNAAQRMQLIQILNLIMNVINCEITNHMRLLTDAKSTQYKLAKYKQMFDLASHSNNNSTNNSNNNILSTGFTASTNSLSYPTAILHSRSSATSLLDKSWWHSQQLEELRNLQESVTKEKETFKKESEVERAALEAERNQIKAEREKMESLKERLKADQDLMETQKATIQQYWADVVHHRNATKINAAQHVNHYQTSTNLSSQYAVKRQQQQPQTQDHSTSNLNIPAVSHFRSKSYEDSMLNVSGLPSATYFIKNPLIPEEDTTILNNVVNNPNKSNNPNIPSHLICSTNQKKLLRSHQSVTHASLKHTSTSNNLLASGKGNSSSSNALGSSYSFSFKRFQDWKDHHYNSGDTTNSTTANSKITSSGAKFLTDISSKKNVKTDDSHQRKSFILPTPSSIRCSNSQYKNSTGYNGSNSNASRVSCISMRPKSPSAKSTILSRTPSASPRLGRRSNIFNNSLTAHQASKYLRSYQTALSLGPVPPIPSNANRLALDDLTRGEHESNYGNDYVQILASSTTNSNAEKASGSGPKQQKQPPQATTYSTSNSISKGSRKIETLTNHPTITMSVKTGGTYSHPSNLFSQKSRTQIFTNPTQLIGGTNQKHFVHRESRVPNSFANNTKDKIYGKNIAANKFKTIGQASTQTSLGFSGPENQILPMKLACTINGNIQQQFHTNTEPINIATIPHPSSLSKGYMGGGGCNINDVNNKTIRNTEEFSKSTTNRNTPCENTVLTNRNTTTGTTTSSVTTPYVLSYKKAFKNPKNLVDRLSLHLTTASGNVTPSSSYYSNNNSLPSISIRNNMISKAEHANTQSIDQSLAAQSCELLCEYDDSTNHIYEEPYMMMENLVESSPSTQRQQSLSSLSKDDGTQSPKYIQSIYYF